MNKDLIKLANYLKVKKYSEELGYLYSILKNANEDDSSADLNSMRPDEFFHALQDGLLGIDINNLSPEEFEMIKDKAIELPKYKDSWDMNYNDMVAKGLLTEKLMFEIFNQQSRNRKKQKEEALKMLAEDPKLARPRDFFNMLKKGLLNFDINNLSPEEYDLILEKITEGRLEGNSVYYYSKGFIPGEMIKDIPKAAKSSTAPGAVAIFENKDLFNEDDFNKYIEHNSDKLIENLEYDDKYIITIFKYSEYIPDGLFDRYKKYLIEDLNGDIAADLYRLKKTEGDKFFKKLSYEFLEDSLLNGMFLGVDIPEELNGTDIDKNIEKRFSDFEKKEMALKDKLRDFVENDEMTKNYFPEGDYSIDYYVVNEGHFGFEESKENDLYIDIGPNRIYYYAQAVEKR